MPSYGISELASGLQNRQDYSGMITPAEHKAVLEGEVTCQHMPVAVHVWGDYCLFFLVHFSADESCLAAVEEGVVFLCLVSPSPRLPWLEFPLFPLQMP